VGAALPVLKELFGEESVKEISLAGSVQDVFYRIRTAIDPFFVHCDEEDAVRLAVEVNEEEDAVALGEYGSYCPATLKTDNWLLPGKSDHEVYVRGRKHKFFSEKELLYFREHLPEFVFSA